MFSIICGYSNLNIIMMSVRRCNRRLKPPSYNNSTPPCRGENIVYDIIVTRSPKNQYTVHPEILIDILVNLFFDNITYTYTYIYHSWFYLIHD